MDFRLDTLVTGLLPRICLRAGTALLLTLALASHTRAEEPLTRWVDPLIGTQSTHALSGGNTYPATGRPQGMTYWAPQTGTYESSLFYSHDSDSLTGIRATHQASVWMADYGDFSLMPVTGSPGFLPHERGSPFLHERESSKPERYAVHLPRYAIDVEITPTSRCAIMRLHSSRHDTVTLIIDPHPPGTVIEVEPETATLRAMTATRTAGAPENFRSFLAMSFDRSPVAWGTWTDTTDAPGETYAEGDHNGAWVSFAGVLDTPVVIRLGTSFLGAGQAARNMQQELGNADFGTIRQQAADEWQAALSRVRIEGGSEQRRTVFYTALYRSLLFPRTWSEYDGSGQQLHFSPYDGRIHQGAMIADLGLWDSYRSHLPLYFLLYTEAADEILQGLLNAYKQSGWFPRWMSPGPRKAMPGTQAEIIFADAWAKGRRAFDAQLAYQGLRRNATVPGDEHRGRVALAEYERLGYVPADQFDGSVSMTLDYSYGDYCLALLAEALGHEQDRELFLRRSDNWRNVFDEDKRFVRGRRSNGSWMPLDPIEWGGPFVEGNAWHYTWAAQHAPAGLMELMGGPQPMAARLDSLLQAPPEIRTGTYGRRIHEMNELVAGGTGQYLHGNQPCHHVLYLYNHTHDVWKTAPLIRAIGDRLYTAQPDGYPGDEDTGSLGSWYVFSALGMYPAQPGVPLYSLGAPRFVRAELALPNGNSFVVEAPGIDSAGAVYVQSVSLNGQRLSTPFISHEQIVAGGSLVFSMGTRPNTGLYD